MGWLDRAYRITRGTFIGLILFLSLTVGSAAVHIPVLLMMWSVSTRLWRYVNSTFIELWHNLFVFYLEVWNKKRWVVTGDKVPPKEWVFIVSNHPSEVDWMCWWPIARRKGMVGDLKVILKQEIAYVPGLGNGMDDLEFLFLARDWEKDKDTVAHRIESWKQDKTPLWLTFFPEGTDFSVEKHKRSVNYAKEHGLASYQNLLVPRVTGFVACSRMLGTYIDAIYDFTLAYANSPLPTPLRALLDISPREVHLHIRRYPVSQLPVDDEEKMKEWIYQCWKEKDELLDYFKEHQHFPSKEGARPSELKPSPVLYGWALWWLAMIALGFYRCFTSTGFLVVALLCTAIRVATTYNKKIRQWRGLLPPDNYRKKSL